MSPGYQRAWVLDSWWAILIVLTGLEPAIDTSTVLAEMAWLMGQPRTR